MRCHWVTDSVVEVPTQNRRKEAGTNWHHSLASKCQYPKRNGAKSRLPAGTSREADESVVADKIELPVQYFVCV
jgi:hypothetical protein